MNENAAFPFKNTQNKEKNKEKNNLICFKSLKDCEKCWSAKKWSKNKQTKKKKKKSTLAFYCLACRKIVQSERINLDILSAMYRYCIK